jgi:catechol 2,3-dioxygenase-like lactoylglutathione lyase family enzyme
MEVVMNIMSFYPVLMTSNVKGLKDFYCERFDFSVAFETNWYVSLKKSQGPVVFELAILEPNHPTVPSGFGTNTRGVILNFEVENAREEYDRLVKQSGIKELLPLRDEDFGQRHFMILDPAGNIIDIIQNIAPSEDYADHYTHGSGDVAKHAGGGG